MQQVGKPVKYNITLWIIKQEHGGIGSTRSKMYGYLTWSIDINMDINNFHL